MKNLFYFRYLNVIGGIEQFFAYLTDKYRDWDITIVYRTGDENQINRLRKYANVVKFDATKRYECDKAFLCFNSEIKPYLDAKEINLILHGDYKAMVEQGQLAKDCYIFTEEFDKFYGVSQTVCDSWKEITGKDAILTYNPYVFDKPKKILRLVYCGRLTGEKGGDLIQKLINRLNERGIEYQLFVYSNEDKFKGDRIYYLGTRLDACSFLNRDNYDYQIIPSKNEGYCYSLVQGLAHSLPAVATPCPVFKELGLDETNSITIDFDGKNIDEVIDNMLSKNLNFTYTPKEDNWDKILVKGKTEYKHRDIQLRVVRKYWDLELNRLLSPGDKFFTTKERAEELISTGCVQFVEE